MHAPWAFKEKHIGLNISGTKELVPKNFFFQGVDHEFTILTTISSDAEPQNRHLPGHRGTFSDLQRMGSAHMFNSATGRSDGPKGSDASSGDTVTSLRRGKPTLALLNCDIVDFQISVN